MLPLFKKVMQNFILVQNKGIGQGLVKRLVPFSQKVLFLANIRCCPNFLDYALECCGFDIENYFWNAQVWLTTPI